MGRVNFIKSISLFFVILLNITGCNFNANIKDLLNNEDSGSTSPDPTPDQGSGDFNVSIDQSSTQPDPTSTLPVRFILSFSEPIDPTTFDLNDLSISGTASGLNWNLSDTGDHKTFFLDASTNTANGTIVVSLNSNNIKSTSGLENANAKIIDNEVTIVPSNLPHVLKDINVGDDGSDPKNFYKINNHIVFNALHMRSYNLSTKQFENINTSKPALNSNNIVGALNNYIYYIESTDTTNNLWRTDGTDLGTHLVKDFSSSIGTVIIRAEKTGIEKSNTQNVFNNHIYFTVDGAFGDGQIWKTDGTDSGTVMVYDPEPGASSSDSVYFVGEAQNKLFFMAITSTEGLELYVTEGTSATTSSIIVRTGTTSGASVQDAVILNDKVIFGCNFSASGWELCQSSGTLGTTSVIKEIYAGTTSGLDGFKGVADNILYFRARTAANGRELWATDGTTANTQELLNVNPSGDGNYNFYQISQINSNKFYFMAETAGSGMRLWVSSGTPASTSLLVDLHPGTSAIDTQDGIFSKMAIHNNNKFYFLVNTTIEGTEYWVTDGTPAGTSLLKDINPGAGNGFYTNSYNFGDGNLAFKGSKVFFAANNGSEVELWESMGTPSTTVQTKDINVGSKLSSFPSNFFVDDNIYFAATGSLIGNELWVSDGTSGGTVLLKNLNLKSAPSNISNFEILGSKLYFSGTSAEAGIELMSTDGTVENTANLSNGSIIDIAEGNFSSNVSDLTEFGGQLLFIAKNNIYDHKTLWASDGTLSGTQIINSDLGSVWISDIIKADSFVYFVSNYITGSINLWKSNGTTAGTVNVNNSIFFDYELIGVTQGDSLLFNYSFGDMEPGFSNGTNASIINMSASGGSSPEFTVATDNEMYFVADPAGGTGEELYKINSGSPVLVAEINPTGDASPRYILADGNILYFIATDGSGSDFLYKTDGVTTVQIKEVSPVHDPFVYAFGVKMGSNIYFALDSGVNAHKLWKSDGTTAGTAEIKTLCSSNCNDFANNFYSDGSKFYFSMDDGVHGTELWTSDGTSSGTYITDLNPGAESSSPQNFIKFGTKIYFTAEDANYGNELWVIPNP